MISVRDQLTMKQLLQASLLTHGGIRERRSHFLGPDIRGFGIVKQTDNNTIEKGTTRGRDWGRFGPVESDGVLSEKVHSGTSSSSTSVLFTKCQYFLGKEIC